jgi:hypothetical protein
MFERIQHIKYVIVMVAICIAVGSLIVSSLMIRDLEAEERERVEIWSEAMRSLNHADENTDLSLVIRVLNSNHIIPVIVLDKQGEVLTFRNINKEFRENEDSIAYISRLAENYRAMGKEIKIDMTTDYDNDDYIIVCYDESIMLRRLAVYPYIQLCIVCLFVLISIFALFATTRAEQNKVWVGLSKETAHQLGTPISSLMAWNEVFKEAYPDDPLISEMEKDVKRLERIAERFSKIGSVPEPKQENILDVLERVVVYMDKRTSRKVKIVTHFPEAPVRVNLISSLFEWVAENLCKNAVDAMGGSGQIDIYVDETDKNVYVEVSDTGKGIPTGNFQSVFKPGFTTKERGWGLGLSLAKRIIEEYHHGKIYVKDSELNVGTTFRIELQKN